MNQEAVYQTLLRTTQDAYAGNAEMTGFTPFPDDIVRQAVTPFHSTCCDVFCEDKKLVSQKYPALQDAIRAARSEGVERAHSYRCCMSFKRQLYSTTFYSSVLRSAFVKQSTNASARRVGHLSLGLDLDQDFK
jgi:hypothetical protein